MISTKDKILFIFILCFIVINSAYPDNSSGWEKVVEKDDIAIFISSTPGSPIVSAKGITTLDSDPLVVLEILNNNYDYISWVPRILDAYTVKIFTDEKWMEYILFNAPWPLDDREFLILKEIATEPDNIIHINFTSIDTNLIEKKPNIVRANVNNGSIHLSRSHDNKTKIEIITHADLKGFIPAWIMNYIQEIWPLETLRSLRLQVRKYNSR